MHDQCTLSIGETGRVRRTGPGWLSEPRSRLRLTFANPRMITLHTGDQGPRSRPTPHREPNGPLGTPGKAWPQDRQAARVNAASLRG